MFNWVKKISLGSKPGRADNPVELESIFPKPSAQQVAKSTSYKNEGNMFLSQGKLGDAARCYTESIALVPDDVDSHINLGYLLMQQGKHAEAVDFLTQAIEFKPDAADAFYMLGSICRSRSDFLGAIKNFESAIDIKPDFETVYLDLCQVLFQAGQAERAQVLAIKAIGLYPENAHAHYLLGKFHMHEMEMQRAQKCFQLASTIQPNNAEIHLNLGIVLHSQGKLDEAIGSYKQAISIQPANVEAHKNLGIALHARGSVDGAVESFHRVLELDPLDHEALHSIGNIYHAKGALEEAAASYRKALSLNPEYADAYGNLGCVLHEQGKCEDAIESYRNALAIKSDFAEAHNNLGLALRESGKLDAAIECFQAALSIRPVYAEAHNNWGLVLQQQRKFEDAIARYRIALSFHPDLAKAYDNLGGALREVGQLDAAIENHRKAIFLAPNVVSSHNNLGISLQERGDLDEAQKSYGNAIALNPDYADAWCNLAGALQLSGKLETSVNCFERGLALSPELIQVHSSLLYTLSLDGGRSGAGYLEKARLYGAKVFAIAVPYIEWPRSLKAQRDRPLRVGLVSGDLREHPVGYFLEGILRHLDKERIELTAFSTQRKEDALTARIKPYFVQWHSLAGLDDASAARKIHDDGIDILIDLAGHTTHNRLPLFAWKPAPVQVSWLGYWASTGVPGIDYVIADAVAVPGMYSAHFTEALWHLPYTRLCFTPPTNISYSRSPPLLHNGFVTFGCFQNANKINADVLALWGKIFAQVPSAHLRLQSKQMNEESARAEMLQRLDGVGIGNERVKLVGTMCREDYLNSHAEVDIILDTFPFPGGTTTCEALWMGVPTLTIVAGDSMLSRQGASLLDCAGLPDWIAEDEDDYVAKALDYAADVSELTVLRAGLREKVHASPLFNSVLFARNLEDALTSMWLSRVADGGRPNLKGA